jgi:hypothetical protein
MFFGLEKEEGKEMRKRGEENIIYSRLKVRKRRIGKTIISNDRRVNEEKNKKKEKGF